jgi:hypothetical protein
MAGFRGRRGAARRRRRLAAAIPARARQTPARGRAGRARLCPTVTGRAPLPAAELPFSGRGALSAAGGSICCSKPQPGPGVAGALPLLPRTRPYPGRQTVPSGRGALSAAGGSLHRGKPWLGAGGGGRVRRCYRKRAPTPAAKLHRVGGGPSPPRAALSVAANASQGPGVAGAFAAIIKNAPLPRPPNCTEWAGGPLRRGRLSLLRQTPARGWDGCRRLGEGSPPEASATPADRRNPQHRKPPNGR